jgi:hypothetical protein
VVCSHNTSSCVAAGPFHVLHMWPMSDVLLRNKLLLAHLGQAKSIFRMNPDRSFEASNQIWAQTHAVCSYDLPWHLFICCCWTIPCPPYVTNENVWSFDGGYLSLVHLCQAKSLYWLDHVQSFEISNQIWT